MEIPVAAAGGIKLKAQNVTISSLMLEYIKEQNTKYNNAFSNFGCTHPTFLKGLHCGDLDFHLPCVFSPLWPRP